MTRDALDALFAEALDSWADQQAMPDPTAIESLRLRWETARGRLPTCECDSVATFVVDTTGLDGRVYYCGACLPPHRELAAVRLR